MKFRYQHISNGGINAKNWQMTTESIEILSNLNQKISEGVYREVYRYNGFAVKKAKRNITKILLFIKVRIPTSLYTLVKFAIRDLNEYEYKQYRSIISKTPPNLHMCFAKIHKPIKGNKASYSINLLGANYNSSGCWQLIQTTAAFFPMIVVQASDITVRDVAYFVGGSTVEPSVNTVPVVIFLKQKQFPL